MQVLAPIGSVLLSFAPGCDADGPPPVSPSAPPAATARAEPRAEPRSEHGFTRNVAALVFEGVELLDFSGPIEVFTNTRRWDEPLRVYTVGVDTRPIRTGNQLKVVADYALPDAPLPDILVIPGGEVACLDRDEPLGRYIRAQAARVEIVFSVCNGVFSLADAGLLDGLEATTHWTAIGWLRESAPRTVVREDCRFVDNGRIVTAAGISAGIDGALHLVERLLGPECARTTARRMEYEWKDAPTEVDAPDDLVERARREWYCARWSAVAEDYAAIVAQRPDDAIASMRLGTGLLFTRRPEEALVHLRHAEELGVRSVMLYGALGHALTKLSRPAEALEACTRAFELDPTSLQSRRALGMAQSAAGHPRDAIANLKEVLAHNQRNPEITGTLARCQASTGDREGAIETLSIHASSAPDEFAELLADPAFAALRDDPRVVALVDRASKEMR